MSRYRCILLGHEENMIQRTLDALTDKDRINSIVVVGGVNVLAIVENTIPNNLAWKDEWTSRLTEHGLTSSGPSKPKPAKSKFT